MEQGGEALVGAGGVGLHARGAGAIAALPRLARRLPDTLAKTMSRLHRLDVTPVRKRMAAAGIDMSSVGAVIESLTTGAALSGRADLEAASRWLIEYAPAAGPEVVCHGDLHPFNVLVDAEGKVDPASLRWHEGVICLRALVEVAGWVTAGTPTGGPGTPGSCPVRPSPLASPR